MPRRRQPQYGAGFFDFVKKVAKGALDVAKATKLPSTLAAATGRPGVAAGLSALGLGKRRRKAGARRKTAPRRKPAARRKMRGGGTAQLARRNVLASRFRGPPQGTIVF